MLLSIAYSFRFRQCARFFKWLVACAEVTPGLALARGRLAALVFSPQLGVGRREARSAGGPRLRVSLTSVGQSAVL